MVILGTRSKPNVIIPGAGRGVRNFTERRPSAGSRVWASISPPVCMTAVCLRYLFCRTSTVADSAIDWSQRRVARAVAARQVVARIRDVCTWQVAAVQGSLRSGPLLRVTLPRRPHDQMVS
jgi:hypothetical protein